MGTKFRKPLELKPSRIGPPRLDKDSRLLARFYEPLFFLRALGQTRGAHTRQPRNTDDATERRRKFLENLCFVCDFTKGGESCTAMALEDCTIKYQFWISSNGNNAGVVEFLREALRFLCGTIHLTGQEQVDMESEFTQFCAEFAKSRIAEGQKQLQTQSKQCLEKMQDWTTKRGKRGKFDDLMILFLQSKLTSSIQMMN
jgi:hypothetical protein